MSTFIIPLFDIVTDPANPIDLEALPVEEAEEVVRELYGFLSPLVEVSVQAGMAVITLPEENERKAERALEQIKDASRAAGSGSYAQAIRLYEQALQVLPAHTEARRELAMAQLESGKAAAALPNLIRVLQLDPKDAWAYLILGNLYFKVEKDLGSAERYYALAVELAPEDPYILNSYASLLAERGKADEAQAMWQRAIDVAPDYPNPRLGMATLLGRQGNNRDAVSTLDTLLRLPAAQDARSATVFESARRLYAE
jgi:tetratricopeptide (TPR) repeat protein